MGENTRKNRRAKVLSMTVRYRSATLGEFIEHHSYDVSNGGMFIKTPSPFPPGTLLKFEVKIAEEQRVMQGVGRVVWKRDVAGDSEDDPAGMGIKFIKIDEASRAVIHRLVDERGGGTSGAFDQSPDSTPSQMFPDSGAPLETAPEDRTVMKPASELLEDALRKAAGDTPPVAPALVVPSSEEVAPESPAGDGAKNTSSFAPVVPERTRLSSSPQDESIVEEEPAPEHKPSAHRETDAPSTEKQRSQSRTSNGGHEEREEGGGRAMLTLLAALALAFGIYFVTKSSTQSSHRIEAEASAAQGDSSLNSVPSQGTQGELPLEASKAATPLPAEPALEVPDEQALLAAAELKRVADQQAVAEKEKLLEEEVAREKAARDEAQKKARARQAAIRRRKRQKQPSVAKVTKSDPDVSVAPKSTPSPSPKELGTPTPTTEDPTPPQQSPQLAAPATPATPAAPTPAPQTVPETPKAPVPSAPDKTPG